MLDKKKTTRLTKIIAIFIALTFVGSFIPFITNVGSTQRAPNTPLVDTTVQSQENQIQGLFSQADFNFDNKSYEQSASFYEQILQIESDNIDAKAGLAASKLQLGQIQESYDSLSQIVAENPDHSQSHFYLGEAAKKLGNLDEAKETYEKYLALEPDGDHAEEAKRAIDEL